MSTRRLHPVKIVGVEAVRPCAESGTRFLTGSRNQDEALPGFELGLNVVCFFSYTVSIISPPPLLYRAAARRALAPHAWHNALRAQSRLGSS